MAESSSFKVEDGDILMLATDGLFDNLSEDMIVQKIGSLHVRIFFISSNFMDKNDPFFLKEISLCSRFSV